MAGEEDVKDGVGSGLDTLRSEVGAYLGAHAEHLVGNTGEKLTGLTQKLLDAASGDGGGGDFIEGVGSRILEGESPFKAVVAEKAGDVSLWSGAERPRPRLSGRLRCWRASGCGSLGAPHAARHGSGRPGRRRRCGPAALKAMGAVDLLTQHVGRLAARPAAPRQGPGSVPGAVPGVGAG